MQTPDNVIVVGAGPTGLLVAGELALRGVPVEVLEQRTEPDTTIKAGSINVATAEAFERRGLRAAAAAAHRAYTAQMAEFAASLSDASEDWDSQRRGHVEREDADRFPVTGHFAGMLFRPDLVDRHHPVVAAHGHVNGTTLVPQADVERILAEHDARLGVVVRRGVEVRSVEQHDGLVHLGTSDGDRTARWVVATDGGRSPIRKSLGVAFDGTGPEITGYQAIADLDGAGALRPGWTWTPTGLYSFGPIPGRILTVQFTGAPADRDAPVTAGELEASIRLVSGADVRVRGLHGRATRWTDNARQAATYRVRRVLLAGDAAHVHSPFSGQGLNLGVGDATNLGWKLAAVARGEADDVLLDTYESERRPIGAWILDWTLAQVALMRGDDKTRELRRLVAEQFLSTGQAATRAALLASGVLQTYDLGDGLPDPEQDLIGTLVGDIPLSAGGRLSDHAHDGRFVLLDRSVDRQHAASVSGPAGVADRIAVVTEQDASPDCPARFLDLDGLLVRPDGVIAWAARRDEQPATNLSGALGRWVGAAAVPADVQLAEIS